jgi:RNA polymerase sigma factor (sigma-70 family)
LALPSTTVTAMSAWSDEALLAATRVGDDLAFAELYERHASAARAVARGLVPSSDVDDVVADAYANILATIQRGAGPELAFRPYLLVSVRNTCYRRSKRRAVVLVDPLESELDRASSEPDPFAAITESSTVAKAFFSLPERWQQVLWHTEVEGRRPSELCAELGLSAGAIAALSFRAREGLSQAYLEACLSPHRPPGECGVVTSMLPSYVRRKATDSEGRVVRSHLEHCTKCTATFDELRDANRPLRSLLAPALLGVPAGAFLPRLFGGAVRTARRVLTAKTLAVATATTVALGVSNVADRPYGLGRAGSIATATTVDAGVPGDSPSNSGGSESVPPPRNPRPPDASQTDASTPPGPSPSDPGAGSAPGSDAPTVEAGTVSTEPAIAPPELTIPSIPTATVPSVTIPEVTVPEVTVPSVTLPPVTVPAVTLPLVTVPEVTLPPVTVPEVTLPALTVPETTVPEITVPPLDVSLTRGDISLEVTLGG